MRKFLLGVVFSSVLLLAVPGCYSTLEGRMKPGVPFSKDEIVNRYERPVDQIVAAAREVLAFNGTIDFDDRVNNVLKARVDTRTVWVQVVEVDVNLSEVTVQARTRGGVSDIDLASEVSTQIALRLR